MGCYACRQLSNKHKHSQGTTAAIWQQQQQHEEKSSRSTATRKRQRIRDRQGNQAKLQPKAVRCSLCCCVHVWDVSVQGQPAATLTSLQQQQQLSGSPSLLQQGLWRCRPEMRDVLYCAAQTTNTAQQQRLLQLS
jgi:hypothetical protein